MISVGSNVRSNSDALKKCPVKYLCDAIRSPRPDIAAIIKRLRIVLQIDSSQYSEMKKQLPFFVCGIFNPPFRKLENFAYTEYFVVDIDHVSEKDLSITLLREMLTKDSRVVMCFMSPSGDGMKVLFRLSERCYDAGLYRVFYKLFINEFSDRYGLQQVVDGKTCDVSRACFVSEDPMVYFNPDAERVDIKAYIDPSENVNEAFLLKKTVEAEIKENERELPRQMRSDPDQEAMDAIRQTLKPLKKPIDKRDVFVPEILNDIMADLKTFVFEKGIEITEVINIQYGKKLRFKLGIREAEINLFYGKRGFSVVVSPRTGTDKEMNNLMCEVIEAFLAYYCNR